MTLTEELKAVLCRHGAGLTGVGDMRGIAGCAFKTGVSVAVPLPAEIILDLREAPTVEYYHQYHALNQTLNEIVAAGEKFLRDRGFAAWAQTTDRISISRDRTTPLPHKTVATRAGLGWIGRNCLLVTPQYGPAVRISSLLTDAPLDCDKPIRHSRCGACSRCVRSCPAQALKDTLWEAGMPREEIVDVEKCREKQLEIMTERTGIATDLCGKCFAVCVYTEKYLKAMDAIN